MIDTLHRSWRVSGTVYCAVLYVVGAIQHGFNRIWLDFIVFFFATLCSVMFYFIIFCFHFVLLHLKLFSFIILYDIIILDSMVFDYIWFDLTLIRFDSIWCYSNRTGEGGRATLFPGDEFSLSCVCIPLLARLFMDLAVWTACDFFQYRNPTTAAKQNPTSAATALQAEEIALDVPAVPVYREMNWDF